MSQGASGFNRRNRSREYGLTPVGPVSYDLHMLCAFHRLPCFLVALGLLVSPALSVFALFTTKPTSIKAFAHVPAHHIVNCYWKMPDSAALCIAIMKDLSHVLGGLMNFPGTG
jgi:hypothetical protein